MSGEHAHEVMLRRGSFGLTPRTLRREIMNRVGWESLAPVETSNLRGSQERRRRDGEGSMVDLGHLDDTREPRSLKRPIRPPVFLLSRDVGLWC